MAKINYEQSLDSFQDVWDNFDDAELIVKRDSATKVVLEDPDGNQLEFTGKKLDWDDAGLVGGKVQGIELSDGSGNELFELKETRIDATDIQVAFDEGGLNAVLTAVLAGDDEIEGSDGNDWLVGGDGRDKIDGDKGRDWLFGGEDNDQLTGGKDRDYFVFEADGSDDVVKDFNTNGKAHDVIAVDADLVETATWERDGKNLVVSFEGEGSIELKGVKPGEFDHDFIVALPEETMV